MRVPSVVLVGESNPYGADPRYALYPDPPGCAGYRLCHKVLGIDARDYLRAFERVNLLQGPRWSVPKARAAASALVQRTDGGWSRPGGRPLVLLGRRVAAAFGLGDILPFTRVPIGEWTFVLLPHPSGRCRAWNDPGSFERARALVLPLVRSQSGGDEVDPPCQST